MIKNQNLLADGEVIQIVKTFKTISEVNFTYVSKPVGGYIWLVSE